MKHPLRLTAFFILFLSSNGRQPATKSPAALAPLQKDSGAAVLPNSANPYAPLDISPMDIAYFPGDYPIAKMEQPGMPMPKARVIYSRPHRQGRTIFGSLLKYGEPWRLGANEATEIELFENATIQGKEVARGRYSLYSIPQAASWTIVFNRNIYSWGLKQEADQDVYRFSIPVEPTAVPIEYYTMTFQKTSTGADLLMAWDAVLAKLPITF